MSHFSIILWIICKSSFHKIMELMPETVPVVTSDSDHLNVPSNYVQIRVFQRSVSHSKCLIVSNNINETSIVRK